MPVFEQRGDSIVCTRTYIQYVCINPWTKNSSSHWYVSPYDIHALVSVVWYYPFLVCKCVGRSFCLLSWLDCITAVNDLLWFFGALELYQVSLHQSCLWMSQLQGESPSGPTILVEWDDLMYFGSKHAISKKLIHGIWILNG